MWVSDFCSKKKKYVDISRKIGDNEKYCDIVRLIGHMDGVEAAKRR